MAVTTEALADILTREHHEIDTGIEQFVTALDAGTLAAEPLERSMDALRRHIYIEEVILFPPLRQLGLMMPVMVMLREHGELWRKMDQVTEALRAADDDEGQPVAAQCRELLAMLDQHNMKEEPILYPHADADLPEDTQAQLRAYLGSGGIPDGWICETAR